MLRTTLIGTFGLSEEEVKIVQSNVPAKSCEVMDTDCITDIIAVNEMAVIIRWDAMSEEDKDLLIGFYTEIVPFPETLILIGDPDIPDALRKCASVYDTFDSFSLNMKYILLGAYRRNRKNENFSSTLANTIMILSEIRKEPYVTTRELAKKLELTDRTIQRYIETLRVAGEWIEYDPSHKGWKLCEGKSVLWGDFGGVNDGSQD